MTENTPTTRRPGGRTARVRARILDATTELVARHGIDGFGYDDIAALAEVHKTSVYRNWPDRDQLISEAILHATHDMLTVQDTGDLRTDLITFLVALADSLRSPQGQSLLQAARSAQQNPATRRTVTDIYAQRTSLIQHRLDTAVTNGELPPLDNYLITLMLSGPVYSCLDQGLRPFTRTEAERITDIVLAGIRHATP